MKQHLANVAAVKRVEPPQELANAAVWLLCDLSSYVTGLVREVDGGLTAGTPL